MHLAPHYEFVDEMRKANRRNVVLLQKSEALNAPGPDKNI
jgi:hypothetical protein